MQAITSKEIKKALEGAKDSEIFSIKILFSDKTTDFLKS